MKFSLHIALALSTAISAGKLSYLGDKAYRIAVGDASLELTNIISNLGLETWKGVNDGVAVANGFVDLVVPAAKVTKFAELSKGFEVKVMHDDLGLSIQGEGHNAAPYIAGRSMDKRDLSWWDSYHPYAEHITFMEDLVATYPKNSKIVYAGKSVEGRPITGVHIWGRDGPGKNKAVILNGNVHAREWISSKVVEYLLHFILTNLDSSNEIRKFVNRYDFHIFPIVNPDGFSYTQTNERLWRKNRQVLNSTTPCGARDINRNWPFQWNGTRGASVDPCATQYKGLAPADTPEIQGLKAYNYKLTSTTGVQLFIDWHSYGQLFLSPYGYDCAAYPPNHDAHLKISRHAADAVREVYGTSYTYGQSCNFLYQTTGYSVDYNYAVGKAKYSYLIELRDRGTFGFVLPAVQIMPTVLETWQGFREILKRI